jgi:uncharacterized membrane protein
MDTAKSELLQIAAFFSVTAAFSACFNQWQGFTVFASITAFVLYKAATHKPREENEND